jgi:hypothetical protein
LQKENLKLSDALLRKLKPTGDRYEIPDGITIGLRARVSASGKAKFILKAKNSANQLKTITLGTYPEMSLKEARDQALKSRLELKAGKDVNADKRRLRQPGMPPLKWSTNWDMIVPFLGGLNDGWETRKAGRYRA